MSRSKATYGPTTLERRNAYFMRPFNHPCLWNGPAWPYSTSVTLAALANLLNDYHQNVVTKDDYVALLKSFAATRTIRTVIRWCAKITTRIRING